MLGLGLFTRLGRVVLVFIVFIVLVTGFADCLLGDYAFAGLELCVVWGLCWWYDFGCGWIVVVIVFVCGVLLLDCRFYCVLFVGMFAFVG